jgi:hypothetical protein
MNYKTLIAFLGKNQMKDWEDHSTRDITGYKNYTQEVCDELKAMFDAGKIDSYPKWPNNGMFGHNRIEWHNAAGRHHRLHNLPATENYNGDEGYFVNGNRKRSDGPSVVMANRIEWDNRSVMDYGRLRKNSSEEEFSFNGGGEGFLEKYYQEIKAAYPAVGKKIFLWDYWTKDMDTASMEVPVRVFLTKHAYFMKIHGLQ